MWLNEASALFVAAKSDTAGGDAVLRDMVRLWIAVRRRLAEMRSPVNVVVEPRPISSRTVGDSDAMTGELQRLIQANAERWQCRPNRVRGWITHEFGPASFKWLSQDLGAYVRKQLLAYLAGSSVPPFGGRRLPPKSDERQGVIVFPPPVGTSTAQA